MEALLARYKEQAAEFNCTPEGYAIAGIQRQLKNLNEFNWQWNNGKRVQRDALHATLDMLRLNVVVLETLVQERENA